MTGVRIRDDESFERALRRFNKFYSKKVIVIEEDLYHAGEQKLFDIVRRQSEEYQTIMLFIHNPGITWFANELCNIYIDNVPTAGIVSIGISTPWNEVTNGSGDLIFFDYPKKAGN